MNILEAIKGRASTRAYLDKPVSRETIEAILETARWAPSGVNTQPWHVWVLTGDTKARLSTALLAARETNQEENPDYQYYPQDWQEPYKSRRKACGLALYASQGIGLQDQEKRKTAWFNNYRFFGAPVGLLFCVERRLSTGAWIDSGMFIQSVMLAARGFDLATCPQAAIAEYPDIVREVVGISKDYALICGMALGYPELNAPVNNYRTEREPVNRFTTWCD